MHILCKKASILKKHDALMSIFCQKTVHSVKTRGSNPHILSKTAHSVKTRCSRAIFFKIFMKKPRLSFTRSVKKRQFCQNYTLLWAKKVNRMPLFSDFSRKNHCSHAHILSKNVHSLKSKQLSCPYFVNISPFSQNFKTMVLSCHFCQNFSFHRKSHILSCHICSKYVNSLETKLF